MTANKFKFLTHFKNHRARPQPKPKPEKEDRPSEYTKCLESTLKTVSKIKGRG